MISIACLGGGWAVRSIWLPLLTSSAAWRVTAVADPSPAARAAVAAQFDRVEVVESLEQLIDSRPDIVLIATPNVLHVAHARQCLERGYAVILEKPACLEEREAVELATLAARMQRQLWVTRASVQRADVQRVAALVDSGKLGRIHALELGWVRASSIPRAGTWFTRKEFAVGGVAADLGWHMLDVGLMLLSYPRIEAALSTAVYDSASGSPNWLDEGAERSTAPKIVDVETRMHSALRTSGGALVTLSLAWCSHQSKDETWVTAHGGEGAVRLRTTFGFSPNGISEPTLYWEHRGHAQALAFEREDKVAPYRSFLQEVASDFATGRFPAMQPLTVVARALELIYAAAKEYSSTPG